MNLYLVSANAMDYDTFDSAVVVAHDEQDAIHLVLSEIDKGIGSDVAGSVFPLAPGAQLTAEPVREERHVILMHGIAG